MVIFSKESLENLRQKIDIVEVIESHVELKRAGASYKACCPFHDEKTPSFTIQRGDKHYHCFGCGAHGDAIQFLTTYLNMNFFEAVESLADKFKVPLETVEKEERGPSKKLMREALEEAKDLYHAFLLHADEAKPALDYLEKRGIDQEFIRTFEIGLAPDHPAFLRKTLQEGKYNPEILRQAGLITQTQRGKWRDFFIDRITFPIHAPSGYVIGFSARKYKEETFGGKYINTSETPLFKKSKVLYGLDLSRARIVKEKRVLLVEGQIDALRLIHAGLDLTVASQGTAFGESHAQELIKLGVKEVYLIYDSDNAGFEAVKKVGDLFQKQGIEVLVVPLPEGSDPDSFVRQEGIEKLINKLQDSPDYLTYVVEKLKSLMDLNSPAAKNNMIQTLSEQIRTWNDQVMVHESLKKLANLLNVPESVMNVDSYIPPPTFFKRSTPVGELVIDPDEVMETDILHWMIKLGSSPFLEVAKERLTPEHFQIPFCQTLFAKIVKGPVELLEIAACTKEEREQRILSTLLSKKVNMDRAEDHIKQAVQKILDRKWLQDREKIRQEIQSGFLSDDEALSLAKQFSSLEKPKIS